MRRRKQPADDMSTWSNADLLKAATAPDPSPPKQFIMYDSDDVDQSRLYTLARLEDATIDKIAQRVVELMDERKAKKK